MFRASSLLIAVVAAVSLAATPATQPAKAYPLDTCIVSGEKLGGMGEPLTETFEGQQFKFCCAGCPEMFHKDTAKYVAKLKAAKPATQPAS